MSTVNLEALLDRLARGWDASQAGLAQEFCHVFREHLGEAGSLKPDAGRFEFVADLGKIRLRGTHTVYCLAVGGSNPALAGVASDYFRRVSAPGRLVCGIAFSAAAEEHLRAGFDSRRSLIVTCSEIRAILTASDPVRDLLRLMRARLPIRTLIPYTILLSAEGNMFYGRDSELQRLRDEDSTSFAIVGPSRIGKTSLLKQYIRSLQRSGDARAAAATYLDLYECTDKRALGVCRAIAMRLESSKRANRLTPDDFVNFLRYQHYRTGFVPTLVLDEVDEVCIDSNVREIWCTAAKQGACRFILAGRRNLLKTMLDPASPLAGRFELLRMEPLDSAAAERLFFDPLTDLGFVFPDRMECRERIFRLTGMLPHLVQFYAGRLAEVAIADGNDEITRDQLDRLQWDFETAQYFVSPLTDLATPQAKVVALSILKNGSPLISVAAAQRAAAEAGVVLSHAETFEICNELVISNVLTWKGGSFRISNDALSFYAKELGFLDQAYSEAVREATGTVAAERI